MATYRILRSGRINVQVRQKGAAPLSGTFDTKREATSWVKSLRANKEKKQSKNINHEATLGSVGRRYCDTQLKGKSSRHLMLQRYQRMARCFPQPFLSITRVEVNAYKNTRLQEVSGSTVREEIQSINKLFLWAEREMIFGDREIGSPARNIALPPASKPLERVVERQELQALMSDLNPLMAEIVELAYETAMRRAEITKLLPRNLNLDKRTVQVERGKTGDRLVPLTKQAVEILRTALQRCPTQESRLYPVAPHSISTAIRRARKRAGLGDHVRMHQLRHTRITEVARRGLNQAQIMVVSGHKDVRSVQRYTHLNVQDVIDLID